MHRVQDNVHCTVTKSKHSDRNAKAVKSAQWSNQNRVNTSKHSDKKNKAVKQFTEVEILFYEWFGTMLFSQNNSYLVDKNNA